MKWTLEEAYNQLTQIIDAATQEPLFIYSQEKVVAAIVDPKQYQELLKLRRVKNFGRDNE